MGDRIISRLHREEGREKYIDRDRERERGKTE